MRYGSALRATWRRIVRYGFALREMAPDIVSRGFALREMAPDIVSRGFALREMAPDIVSRGFALREMPPDIVSRGASPSERANYQAWKGIWTLAQMARSMRAVIANERSVARKSVVAENERCTRARR